MSIFCRSATIASGVKQSRTPRRNELGNSGCPLVSTAGKLRMSSLADRLDQPLEQRHFTRQSARRYPREVVFAGAIDGGRHRPRAITAATGREIPSRRAPRLTSNRLRARRPTRRCEARTSPAECGAAGRGPPAILSRTRKNGAPAQRCLHRHFRPQALSWWKNSASAARSVAAWRARTDLSRFGSSENSSANSAGSLRACRRGGR